MSAPFRERAERIAGDAVRWLVPLVPVALVTVSGVADVFCSLVAIVTLLRAALARDWSWFERPWFIVLLLLWAYLMIRSGFAMQPGRSLGEAFVWLRYPVFAIAVSHVLNLPADRERFVKVIAGCVLFLSVDAIVQYLIGYDIAAQPEQDDLRLTGPFGRPRVGITIAWLFLPPLLALVERRRWPWAIAVGGTAILAILLSRERTSLVTLGIDALALLLVAPLWRRQIAIAAAACAAVLLLVAVARPALYQRQVGSTVQVVAKLDQSPYGVIWSRGLAIAEAHPVAGLGMRTYRVVCPDPAFGPLAEPHGYPRCSTHPHNYYLEWLIAGGIPAVAAFVVAMGLLLRDLLMYGDRRSLLFAGLVATVLMRLWPLAPTTSFFHNWSAIPLFLMIGWALSWLPQRRSPVEQNPAPRVQSA